mmetsp:Transcript_39617/g.128192  ORF Transcript_39617/g.128192 Transcript_39617/m.128192 type:complete len:348 (+) Transcript_39617:49-1092(+)
MLALASLLSVSPLGFSAVPTPEPPEPTPACKTIAELLAETESLSTLNTAVKAIPDVLAALEDPTQTLTVFAPNDDAFSPYAPYILVEIIAGIADGNVQDVEDLSYLLSAHVISGVYKAEDVLALIPGFGEENVINVTTVNGETIYLGSQALAPNSVFVGPVLDGDVGPDPAEVVVPDIEACNGIVHVIDNVLGGDDEGSCLPVNHWNDEPGSGLYSSHITCDCVGPDDPCLEEDCVPEPLCGESCLSTCWTIQGYCLDHEGHSEEECVESMSMMTFPFAQAEDADHFDCDVACTGETHSDDEDRRRLRAKEGKFSTLFEGKNGIKRRLQVGKKGGKAAISFTDKHGI